MSPRSKTRIRRVTRALLRDWPLPDLDSADDKEDRGTALIIGGTAGLAGAVVLAGTAALRAGAGKLQIATCQSAATIVGVTVPESFSIGLDESTDGFFKPSSAELAAHHANEADVVLVGPGMNRGDQTDRFVRELLARIDGACVVIDAGALAPLSKSADALHHFDGSAVLTPHAGEMAALMGVDKDTVMADPPAWASQAAARFQAVVAFKGAETFIADPEGEVYCYSGGSIGLATSGSGDTLAGIVAGLIARGASALQATVWAVYVHGTAGNTLTKKVARVGFLARELLDEVPGAIRGVQTG